MVAAAEFGSVDGEDRAEESAKTDVYDASVLFLAVEFQMGRCNCDCRKGVVNVPLRYDSWLCSKLVFNPTCNAALLLLSAIEYSYFALLACAPEIQ